MTFTGNGEMAPELRAYSALAEDLNSVASTHVECL